jgi:hypothetical protein
MEDVRKKEGLALEELEAERVEFLPDREEMHFRRNRAFAAAVAVQGSTAGATANAGNVFIIDV